MTAIRTPAKCVECGRYTRIVCLTCGSPLCHDHADFPMCLDCTDEEHRQALIDEIDRARDRLREEASGWRSTSD